jgi:hypothetical protein
MREQIEANRVEVVAFLEAMGAEIVDSFVPDEPPPNANVGLKACGEDWNISSIVTAALRQIIHDENRGISVDS